jgi:ferredoxin
MDCVCKKEQALLDNRCDKPMEVCLGIAPVPNAFENPNSGRAITREQAFEVLRKSEEAGLVHLTWNVEQGHFFICNCCGCCCGVLRGINHLGIPASTVVNSYYYAEIDPDLCTGCGTCAEERCQVGAVQEEDDVYEVIRDKCIGCGICITTCPADAISLVRKKPEEIDPPVKNEKAWFEERGRKRGVEFSQYQ